MRLQDFALTLQRSGDFDERKSAQRPYYRHLLRVAKSRVVLSVESLARICVLIVCCVACCLACSEFPETLSLSDDASNDFVVVSETYSAIHSEAVERGAVSKKTIRPTTEPVLASSGDAFPERSPRGSDLLTLISLRRN
jgi:hypothetical protein